MPGETSRFRFTTFTSVNDTLAFRGHKFTAADRVLLDRLLRHAAERHTHTGTGTGPATPAALPAAPLCNAHTTGGAIPPSATLYYCAVVVDDRGQEGPPSQIASVTTIPPVYPPGPITLTAQPGPGALMPGDYLYAVSAYTGDSSSETITSPTASGLLTAVGQFTITLPSPPSGASGFNIYRKAPTDNDLRYLATIDFGSTWADTGSIPPDALRGPPTTNTTASTNSVTVEPAIDLPAGHTLKVYRTYTNSNWDESLLVWTAVMPVLDTGHATRPGAPSSNIVPVGNPPRIDLFEETSGRLPPTATPTTTTVNFSFGGQVARGASAWQWLNEFDQARILTVRASLGRDSTPDSRPVTVALERRSRGTGTWERFRTESGDVTAAIPVGELVSDLVDIPADALPGTILYMGDALRGVVLQDGGGVTQTDFDLTIAVHLAVRQGSGSYSYVIGGGYVAGAGYQGAPGGVPGDIYNPDPEPDPGPDGGDSDTYPDPADGPPRNWSVAFERAGQAPVRTSATTTGTYTVPFKCMIDTVDWTGAGRGNQTIIERLRTGGDWVDVLRITEPTYSGDAAYVPYGQLRSTVILRAGDVLRARMRTGADEPPYRDPQEDFAIELGLLKYGGATPSSPTISAWASPGKATWTVTFQYSSSAVPVHNGDRDAYGSYFIPSPSMPPLNLKVTHLAWWQDDDVGGHLGMSNSPGPTSNYFTFNGSGATAFEMSSGYAVHVFVRCEPSGRSGTYAVTFEDDADTADTDSTVPVNIEW